jgi:hypothetical protein
MQSDRELVGEAADLAAQAACEPNFAVAAV